MLINYQISPGSQCSVLAIGTHTLSCRRLLNKWTSRYVRLARAGVSNGDAIFLTATNEFVIPSCAELLTSQSSIAGDRCITNSPDHPRAATASYLQIRISSSSLKGSAHDFCGYEWNHYGIYNSQSNGKLGKKDRRAQLEYTTLYFPGAYKRMLMSMISYPPPRIRVCQWGGAIFPGTLKRLIRWSKSSPADSPVHWSLRKW